MWSLEVNPNVKSKVLLGVMVTSTLCLAALHTVGAQYLFWGKICILMAGHAVSALAL